MLSNCSLNSGRPTWRSLLPIFNKWGLLSIVQPHYPVKPLAASKKTTQPRISTSETQYEGFAVQNSGPYWKSLWAKKQLLGSTPGYLRACAWKVAVRPSGCIAESGPWLSSMFQNWLERIVNASNPKYNYFFRPTPYSFRQIVHHASRLVAYGLIQLINRVCAFSVLVWYLVVFRIGCYLLCFGLTVIPIPRIIAWMIYCYHHSSTYRHCWTDQLITPPFLFWFVVVFCLVFVFGSGCSLFCLFFNCVFSVGIVTAYWTVYWSYFSSIFEAHLALEHLSWVTFQPLCWPMLTLLPSLIVQCCGTPQNADNDYLSLIKFMHLGPLKSDSYCDSDDKTQPVQLLVKQRSGSQSVDRLAEAPQSFAHDSKHCNHRNPLLSRPNNQSESNQNNNHKAQCKS